MDWSMLNDGFTIPVSVCSILAAWDESMLAHGTTKKIKLLIDGEMFDAKLINQNFNQSNHVGHKDVIQIRYSLKSPIAVKLRAIFHKSYKYYYAKRLILGKSKRRIPLPDTFKEYIQLYFTTSPDVLSMDCCSNEECQKLAYSLKSIPEEIYETDDDQKFFMLDRSASLTEKEMVMKYRKIDRNIIRMLKVYYDYRDEISGEKIGAEYGESVVEAHHIDYFTKSQNNDSTNIIIISPNYHRIIHKNNPHFNRKKYQFEFENGEVLKLKLYEHLKV